MHNYFDYWQIQGGCYIKPKSKSDVYAVEIFVCLGSVIKSATGGNAGHKLLFLDHIS
jgi:hypothetical protein